MSDQTNELYKTLSGFTTEVADGFVLIKIEKDALIKKILSMSHVYELGFEYVIDDKYVVFRIPIEQYGKEALRKVGLGI